LNAPLIWVVIPLFLAVGLYFLQHWNRITVILGVFFALLFAALAAWHSIGELITVGPISYQLGSTLSVFGRRFILDNSDRPILSLTYLLAAFWFAGSYITRAGKLFVPIGLVIVSLLTAAMAVEPFLFAALIIEMVVLVSVPLLSPPGQPLVRGVLRFITFQTFGMPFILFVGWMLAGVEASPGDLDLVTRAMIMAGLGFAFLLGVFPFHSWIPILADQVHPYVFSFILFTLTWMVSLFGLGFFERYAWLRSTEPAYSMIRLVGVIMVMTGGIWAAFQNRLSRIMGYAVIVEIGYLLLAIGIPDSLPLYFAMLLPRLIGLGIWSLSLNSIQSFQGKSGSAILTLTSVQGVARNLPVAVSSIVVANLSIAGFPLLAAFPIRLALWKGLAVTNALFSTLTLLGSMGLMVAGMRSLALFFSKTEDQAWKINEGWTVLFFLVIGIILLFLIGVFPQWFLPPLANLALSFEQLSPGSIP
jgi:formate hydrogenlyase subunit 3/multisubunit Na+/H+ antiporter MnhD subunit